MEGGLAEGSSGQTLLGSHPGAALSLRRSLHFFEPLLSFVKCDHIMPMVIGTPT